MPEEIQSELAVWFQKNWAVALLVFACVVIALASLIWLPKNNPIEQAAEKEIEILTGVPVDFTP